MATHYGSDIERRAALTELMSKRDPVDEVCRHRLVFDGSPNRHLQLPRLAAAYVQAQLVQRLERTSS